MSVINLYTKCCEVVVIPLAKMGFTPSAITLVSLILGIVAGCLIAMGKFWLALAFVFLAGITDSLDGALARISGKVTKFGAVLDSTVDRVVELAIIVGIYYFVAESQPQKTFSAGMLSLLAYSAAVWVSYVKARAEGVGVSPAVGIFQRRHRIVLTVLGVAAAGIFPKTAVKIFMAYLYVLLAGCVITVLQRLVKTKRMLQNRG